MNDSFVPVNVRQGHPHERGLINFLISLFRASALLIVLEFLLDGEVERHRRRVFEEFRRAEELVKEYDELVWSLRKTELVSSIGLILAPYLWDDEDGTLSPVIFLPPRIFIRCVCELRSWDFSFSICVPGFKLADINDRLNRSTSLAYRYLETTSLRRIKTILAIRQKSL